jgi:chemotaxis protein MotA
MGSIVGILVVLVMVFGGYIIAGGKMSIILHALPFEIMIIGGGSFGAFVVASSPAVIKAAGKDMARCFGKGAKWGRDDYIELLSLLFTLTKTIKSKGLLAIEEHIENPESSEIFAKFPNVLADHHVVDFICDTLRMVTMSLDDPYQIEDAMQRQLDKHHHEVLKSAEALQTTADGLPAIGIVAAVLGVIKTMASIDQPPPVLGAMIGGALVGTFLGVFLSYCIVGPIATKAKGIHDKDHQFMLIIRDVLISHLKGNPPQVSVEIGRGQIPSEIQPSFADLEEALSQL